MSNQYYEDDLPCEDPIVFHMENGMTAAEAKAHVKQQHDKEVQKVVNWANEYEEYECTCCYSIQQGHQEHCATWLNEEN